MITEQRFAWGCPTTSGSSHHCAPDGRILGAPPTPAGCGCTPPTPTGPPAPGAELPGPIRMLLLLLTGRTMTVLPHMSGRRAGDHRALRDTACRG